MKWLKAKFFDRYNYQLQNKWFIRVDRTRKTKALAVSSVLEAIAGAITFLTRFFLYNCGYTEFSYYYYYSIESRFLFLQIAGSDARD